MPKLFLVKCNIFISTLLDKLRRDLLQAKDETHTAIQEGMAYKQQSSKSDCELEGAKEQLKQLNLQVKLL